MSTPLRVVAITVKDVLGAREFAIEPGQITTLKGKNGSGKSTALEAVQAALGGGNLAKIARVGKPGELIEPEVVLVIEGKGSEAYRVERKGEKVRVRARVGDSAAFEDVGKPQTWLRALYDPAGANPVTFLTAKDDDRATMLLEALPLDYKREQLLAETGLGDLIVAETAELPALPAGLHPLEEVALIRESVFKTRTGVNRDEKQKRAAAEQTLRNAPAVVPTDPGGEEQGRLEGEAIALGQELTREDSEAGAAEAAALEDARHAFEAADFTIANSFKRDAAKLRGTLSERAAAIRAEAERQVAQLTASTEAEIEKLRLAGEQLIDVETTNRDEARARATAARDDSRKVLAGRRDELARKREDLAALRVTREDSAKARALHEQAKQFENDADTLIDVSERLSKVLDGIDAFRRRLAKSLPIEGLEIEGKQIRVNGVPYAQLNTGQRVDIAVQVAVLRAKGSRLPVVFVDGAEALDTEHFELLVAKLKAAGVQAFLGRVDDSELEVEVA